MFPLLVLFDICPDRAFIDTINRYLQIKNTFQLKKQYTK